MADRLLKGGYIGKHLHSYLIPIHPTPGYLQGNPKFHKEGYPLRVIISGRGHPTERIAELAEKQLESHVVNQPSFIRDTTNFINKLGKTQLSVSTTPLLFCMDVGKLYPSVLRDEGIAACRDALNSRSNPSIPTSDVIFFLYILSEAFDWRD